MPGFRDSFDHQAQCEKRRRREMPMPRRRGKKRALIAVGHSILVIAYHMLKNVTTYADLGAHFLDRLQPQRMTR